MTSYRQIFRSGAIIGGTSVINMGIGIIKMKVLAVLLGPAGIGLMGLYQNIMTMTATLAGCGVDGGGVRQLASSSGDAATLSVVRRTLWLANFVFGLAGMAILWFLRAQVAQLVFGDRAHASEVGWLGLGVLLTLIASSQTALLQGLRRIGDLARVNVISAVIGAVVGILLVYWLGKGGVLWFVLTAPAVSILVAGYYAARLPRPQSVHDWQAIRQQWQAMLKLGIPLMAAGMLAMTTQMIVRSIIVRELGVDASGHFQAAWAISMTYIGIVLGAMVTDYYPRLTASVNDHSQARSLVNEQTEMALLMVGPILLGIITFAPWVIHLLYAESFLPASELLRWQVMGDALKVAIAPMRYISLAQGRGGVFIATELIWNIAYLGAIVLGIQEYGLLMAGVGFLIAYLVYLLVMTFVAAKLIEHQITPRIIMLLLIILIAGGLIIFFKNRYAYTGYGFGFLVTLALSGYSLYRLNGLIDIQGWLKRKFLN